MALCEAAQSRCVWPHIPEGFWQQALAELGEYNPT